MVQFPFEFLSRKFIRFFVTFCFPTNKKHSRNENRSRKLGWSVIRKKELELGNIDHIFKLIRIRVKITANN